MTGLAGLATSYLTAAVLNVREAPVVAVGELVIRATPGNVAERAIALVGQWDKPLLITGVVIGSVAVFVVAGLLGRSHVWLGTLAFTVLGTLAVVAVLTSPVDTQSGLIPVMVGYVTWLAAFGWLTAQLRRPSDAIPVSQPAVVAGASVNGASVDGAPVDGAQVDGVSRRGFLVRVGVVTLVATGAAFGGRVWGAGARKVEQVRKLIRLDGVTMPVVPKGARVGLPGVTAWQTPADQFYRIDTALAVPTIDPQEWTLRIHGLVEREIEVTYQQLLDRQKTEMWVTINCVSNPVGGPLIGNAWWSGVRVADLLALAGPLEGADAVLQTSEDGWTCSTPLAALLDARNALLAVAMNGEPLPIDHGFPVRTIVPGLYGYVSACKWVVDMRVTRFDKIAAYWTERGWSEQGPVKMSSRVDVPASGDKVPAGALRVGGVAWAQYTGIQGVEVSLDGGPWVPAEIGQVPTNDAWVQWAATLQVAAGDHEVTVRAIDKLGEVQTGEVRDVVPDGATGWHSVDFTAEA